MLGLPTRAFSAGVLRKTAAQSYCLQILSHFIPFPRGGGTNDLHPPPNLWFEYRNSMLPVILSRLCKESYPID